MKCLIHRCFRSKIIILLLGIITTGPAKTVSLTREDNYAEKLSAIPGIQQFGPLFRSSETVELTESETEYVVRCVKHVYTNHLVLQVIIFL